MQVPVKLTGIALFMLKCTKLESKLTEVVLMLNCTPQANAMETTVVAPRAAVAATNTR